MSLGVGTERVSLKGEIGVLVPANCPRIIPLDGLNSLHPEKFEDAIHQLRLRV